MRYEDVVRQYVAIQAGVSREWTVSDTLVMCVELDAAADSFMAAALASSSTLRRTPPPLRVTLFRVQPGRPPLAVGAGGAVRAGGVLPEAEHVAIAEREVQIKAWVAGRVAILPPSTSTVISDRLRMKG